MKKLLLLFITFPSIAFAQKPNGYGFIGAGIHFVESTENISGRFNLGIMPSKNVGFGADLQYIRSHGVPILADFRFISNTVKGTRLTIGIKAGQNLYDKSIIKGGFTYGAEAGILIGKNGFYISGQYLSLGYTSKIVDFREHDLAIMIGVKFL